MNLSKCGLLDLNKISGSRIIMINSIVTCSTPYVIYRKIHSPFDCVVSFNTVEPAVKPSTTRSMTVNCIFNLISSIIEV